MKNVKDKVYGIDLDGVCFNFIGEFSSFLKTRLNLDYDDSEITDYYWYRCGLGINEDVFWREFHDFGKMYGMYEYLKPLPGAVEAIKFLMENAKDVWFITGRPTYTYEQTVNSLARHCGIPTDHIIFSTGKDYKSNAVNRLGVDVFIDDAPHYAESLANRTDAKVYLMDATYNQDVDNPKITRVKNWNEFLDAEMCCVK